MDTLTGGDLYCGRVPTLRVAACQLNMVVGAIDANVASILDALAVAEGAGCSLAVFPELAITGYPPEDLLLRSGFVADNLDAVREVAAATRTTNCAAVVGFVDAGPRLFNAAAVCASGEIRGIYHKRLLPNYGVFDEMRYFVAGDETPSLYIVGGVRIGVVVCEDAWSPTGPLRDAAAGGAEVVVSLNASPFFAGRLGHRERMLATRAADAACGLVYVNLVGGQDELVFDGASMVVDADGRIIARASQFREEVMVAEIEIGPQWRRRLSSGATTSGARPALGEVPISPEASRRRPVTNPVVRHLSSEDEVYDALVLATHDYLTKNGFSDAVVGLSGGVDSSLVATIAADALGSDHVHGVAMPSRYSSDASLVDAETLALALGIDFRILPIEGIHLALTETLASAFNGLSQDLTEENLQARIRGTLLMALSNKFGWMVLATGNKSEMAVGFSTLYGDLAGGFAPIKDVPKTLVYTLCHSRNARIVAGGPVISPSVLTKAPSAELRPNQRDDQSLPPYDVLDAILEAYIDRDASIEDMVDKGHDPDLVRRVATMVNRSEHKRRQAPPGVRVSAKAFGKDRRLPLTNGYPG